MAVLKVQDCNGKEFSVETDKIFKISGDVEDFSGSDQVTDSLQKNRVEKVRDIKFVNANGEAIDNLQILKDMKSGKTNVVALDVDMEATHSGKNHNFVIYYEDSMEKDAESFVNPFQKPVLKNHNDISGEPIGRIRQAYHGESSLTDERTAIHLKVRITDSDAIPKFLDGRYQTVSIGGTMGTVTCNVCGKTILKDNKFKFCGHWKGETYKDQVCYWGAKDIEYHEVSVVNNPADDFAQIMKVTVLTSEDGTNNNNNKKEDDQMAANNVNADQIKASICDIIDSMLNGNATEGQPAASEQKPDTGASDSNQTNAGATGDQQTEAGQQGGSETTTDSQVQELQKKIEDLNKENEELKQQLTDAKAETDKAKEDLKTAQTECDSYKEKCVTLAEANKTAIVDSIIVKEIALGAIKEDAKDTRKDELMKMSMKELDAYEPKAPEAAAPRETATVTSPTLATEDKIGDSSNADTNNKTADDSRSVEDFANEIVGKLSK